MTKAEQNPAPNSGEAPPRSYLAPPSGPVAGSLAIFWNERELRAGWRFAIFILVVFLLASIGTVLAVRLHLPMVSRMSITPGSIFTQECILFAATLAATLFMGLLERRPFGTYGLPRSGAFGARFWHGLLWGIAIISATILLIRAFGGFSFGDLALHGAAAWRYATIWGVVFLSVGFFEEFMFRGYVQFTLTMGLGFWPAASVVSAAFGAVHLNNRGESVVGAVSVFVVGMFFCLTLRRTGNLWLAVGLHAAFDWGETFLFSVPDSGLVAPGHLFNSSLYGPAWLTGGTVGPEASVMVFLVLAVAAVIFSRVYRPREEVQWNS
ncbi:MAG: lysostaphin resistance A-like protein [Candidatus Acidiferrales bacterium]